MFARLLVENCVPAGCATFWLATGVVETFPDRVLWGTDWPHPDSTPVAGRKPTDLMPEYQIDDGRLLNQLAVWVPDLAIRKQILVDNPARLYGFQGVKP